MTISISKIARATSKARHHRRGDSPLAPSLEDVFVELTRKNQNNQSKVARA